MPRGGASPGLAAAYGISRLRDPELDLAVDGGVRSDCKGRRIWRFIAA